MPKSKPLSVRIPIELEQQLRRFAGQNELSMTCVIETALRNYFALRSPTMPMEDNAGLDDGSAAGYLLAGEDELNKIVNEQDVGNT